MGFQETPVLFTEHETEFRLVLNLPEKCNYNPYLVWINQNQNRKCSIFPCIYFCFLSNGKQRGYCCPMTTSKNGKEVTEETEGKSGRVHRGR